MSLLFRQGAIVSGPCYRDPAAAMRWLERAFGLEIAFTVEDEAGGFSHIEMRYGDSVITVTAAWADFIKSPLDVGGANTQTLRILLAENIDAHFQRASAAGARILQAPADQVYLQRTYRAADPEGHVWVFAENLPQKS
jgi:uncharacterized glyoxalase superfamily protein PhnB